MCTCRCARGKVEVGTCTRGHTHARAHIHTHTRVRAYTHTRVRAHTHTQTYTYTYTRTTRIHYTIEAHTPRMQPYTHMNYTQIPALTYVLTQHFVVGQGRSR